jgi:8-oxo-dGTP diphosphatase
MDVRRAACAILFGTCGQLILQQRDDVPGIVYPGLVSLFGGHIEPGEDAHACIQRELDEEIGVRLPLAALEPFFTFRARFADAAERDVEIAIYIASGLRAGALHVTEGSLLLLPLAKAAQRFDRMTPTTSYALSEFLHARRLPPKAQQLDRAALAADAAASAAQQ